MTVGVCRLSLGLSQCFSLKEKRQILRQVLQKVRNKFNVSIAETDDNDKWQRAEVGVCAVGNDRRFINSSLDHVLNFIDGLNVAEILDYQIEIINL